MKNVVIVCGHPDLKTSLANKTILDEIAAKCPQVEIRKLCELYPDYQFDIKAEQASLEKADIIVFAYPMSWYSVPGLLKLYIVDKLPTWGILLSTTFASNEGEVLRCLQQGSLPQPWFILQKFLLKSADFTPAQLLSRTQPRRAMDDCS